MTETHALPDLYPVRQLVRGPIVEVWRAEDAGGQAHRLEILNAALSSDAAIATRVCDALERARAVKHPGVVPYRAVGRLPDGRVCAVTERLDGETVDAHSRAKGPLPATEVLELASALAHTLDNLRLRGIVHGAIGPWAIVIEPSAPRLTQFGSEFLGGPDAPRETHGILAGSPYAAPELRSGGPATSDTDLFAVATVLFEVLTGLAPNAHGDPGKTLSVYLESIPPSARRITSEVGQVLRRALATNPSERFTTGAELAHVMRVAVEHPTIEETLLSGEPSPPAPAHLRVEQVGDVFGNYELLALLGEGGMGRVFKARHTRLGRQVALKLLKPEHAQNRGLVQRFFDEARAVNQISHEHIVDIHDFVEDASTSPPRVYCVMELLSGESLADRMMRAPISVNEAVDIVRQVCSALQAAHTVGVYHRDIKPDNIYLAERGGTKDFVKVLDFGVAKLAPSLSGPRGATVAGTIVGTPAYMSPEQASGYEIDGRSDVYTVGVVLYQLLSGRLPFDGDTFLNLAVQITTVAPPPLGPATPFGEPIPPNLATVVMGCLSKDPSGRPVSMTELATLLSPFATPEAPRFPWTPPSLSGEFPESVDPLYSLPSMAQSSGTLMPPPPVPGYTPPQSGTLPEARRAQPPVEAAAAPDFDPSLDVLPRNRAPVVALSVAAFLIAGAAAFLFVSRGADRAEPAPVASQSPHVTDAKPEPATRATEPPSPTNLPESATAKVELRVVSRPPGAAVVRSDTGETLGTTPLDLRLERDSAASLPLRLELSGYVSLETQLPRDQDRVLEVVLNAAKAELKPAVYRKPAPLPKAKPPARKPSEPARAAPELSRDGVLDAYED